MSRDAPRTCKPLTVDRPTGFCYKRYRRCLTSRTIAPGPGKLRRGMMRMVSETAHPAVVVTDYTFRDDLAVEKAILEPLGCTVVGAQCRTEQDVVALVRDADFVLTQFAPITAPSIQAMDKVRLITRYGIGVDNIDLDAARDRCIPVHNVPDYCIAEVADHTLGLILALTRQIVRLSSGVKAGGWTSPPPLQSFHALNELTVGVV